MRTLYALPCPCGQSVDVDRSQAGLPVRCVCGRELEVPTIRGFSELESRSQPTDQPVSTWGPRQGMMFLGMAILILASATAVYLRLVHIANPARIDREAVAKTYDNLTPSETFKEWAELKQGIERTEMPIMLVYWDYLARRERWSWVAWGVAGLGAAITIGGALIPKTGTDGRSRRGPPRKA